MDSVRGAEEHFGGVETVYFKLLILPALDHIDGSVDFLDVVDFELWRWEICLGAAN